MRKEPLQFFARILSVVILSFAFITGAFAYPSGAPAGYTGSPGDGQHCVSCHGGSAATVTGWITTNVPAAGYTAGTAYTITVTVSGTGKKGFEVSPQNASGTQLGTLAAGTGNHTTGGTKYVTQSSSGSTNSTVTWNFTWTAPVLGTGPVTLYGAFCVGKSNTKLSTTVVNENAVLPLAVSVTANPMTIVLGTTSQLNATPSGGSGTYTYSWTSVPAGFTSNIQNPVVSPTTTTQYNVTVGDGSGTVQGSATVTVTALPLSAIASATPSTVCAGQSVQLNVVPAGGSGTYTFSWTSVPAGFTSAIQNPVVTPTASTQYIAHVSDGVASAEASTSVTVNQPATAAAGNDTTFAFVTTQVPLNGQATSYSAVLWTTSGTGTFSAASSLTGNYLPSAADKTAATVTLTLTATPLSPCASPATDTRIIHFDGPIGISEGVRIGMTIAPNPSTGVFKLTVSGLENRNAVVTISEITGRMIVNQIMDSSVGQQMKFDLSGYPKGLYLVKIQSDNQSLVRKLVID
ncbi:MAG: choice-of-anchor V domain-containing protein [Bacteroidales bacterium]